MTIEEGDHVVLETSPPPLDGVLVNGTLEFADDSIVSNDGGDSETGGPDQEGAAIHDATDGGEYEKLVPTTSDVEYVDVELKHNSRLTPSARTTDE